MNPLVSQRGIAPVPLALPGDFFVLEYDRELETFLLRVDDEGLSTYDLGAESAAICALLYQRTAKGHPLQHRQVDFAVDCARELGMAQYIPTDGDLVKDRVLTILPREAHQELNFDGQKETSWIPTLR